MGALSAHHGSHEEFMNDNIHGQRTHIMCGRTSDLRNTSPSTRHLRRSESSFRSIFDGTPLSVRCWVLARRASGPRRLSHATATTDCRCCADPSGASVELSPPPATLRRAGMPPLPQTTQAGAPVADFARSSHQARPPSSLALPAIPRTPMIGRSGNPAWSLTPSLEPETR